MILVDTSTAEENLRRNWENMNALAESLRTATDPAEIDSITREFDSAVRAYWQGLTPEQQTAMAPDLSAWIAKVDLLAQQRIEAARQEVINQGQVLRDHVGILMETMTSPMLLVAAEHGIAAMALQDAAAALEVAGMAAYTAAGGVPLSDAVAPAADIASNAAATASIAADTLRIEGENYRKATDDMVRAVGGIVNAIPTNIPVNANINVHVDVDVDAPATVTTELV
jgi:hypothetical protein